MRRGEAGRELEGGAEEGREDPPAFPLPPAPAERGLPGGAMRWEPPSGLRRPRGAREQKGESRHLALSPHSFQKQELRELLMAISAAQPYFASPTAQEIFFNLLVTFSFPSKSSRLNVSS